MPENVAMDFAQDFCNRMKWDIPLARVKLSQMERYKGLCVTDGEVFYIVLSEKTNEDVKDLFSTLIHELIHAKLMLSKHWRKGHKHGKHFRKLAKKVSKMSHGFYSVQEIV